MMYTPSTSVSTAIDQERKDAGILYNCQIVYVTWKAHDSDPSKCTTCQRYETVAKGRRPRSKVAKLAPGILAPWAHSTVMKSWS